MKFRHPITASFLLAATLVVTGCGPGAESVATLAETVIVGPEYTSKGIYVPDDTRRSLGLKVVAIGEEEIAPTFDLTLRVYECTPSGVRASAFLSPEEAVMLRPGQTLEITTSTGLGAIGTIALVNEDLKDIAGHVEVMVEIAADAAIPVGGFVAAKARVGGTEVVTSVPRTALIQGVDGYFVYTTSGNRFVRTPVVVGASKDDIAEIKEGLYSGDEVVAEPAMSLWLTELAAIKGGHACCAVPAKGK